MNTEPEIMENDLEERIKTSRNRCNIVLLLLELKRNELVPTVLEDLFFGVQTILDMYAVKEEK